MSLFGAMSTAISGMNAQSAAFSNISDNVANSQTIGFKSTNTSFVDYLTTSTATQNQSGSVVTRPDYQNNVQGSIQQSTDPLAMAIDGNGFFAVSEQTGTTSSGQPNFGSQQYYSRDGDFSLDQNGYLVNSSGEYLDGWNVNQATGSVNTSAMAPLKITQTQFQPVATSSVSLLANVPATPSSTSNLSSTVQVYDATGTSHDLNTSWAQTGANAWTLSLSSPDNGGGATIGSVNVTFNADGTLATLTGATGGVAVNAPGTANDASVTLSPSFNGNAQSIKLDLGTFGGTNGVTQFAGTDYDLHSITQNGSAPGAFTGISIASTGAVSANYDNGQSVTVAQVPVVTFENPDGLQRQNGQAFTVTAQSGVAISQDQNQNGAGSLVTGSTEGSNVDIATQLSNLIVAQEAYGANAKVITSANQLLQTTLDMKQ
ncbi:MAG TPA: flagellar hook protein FlgE [Acetobacteraceae bacterium]|nr:flagellar hook protein FlgE [Acetobacteraceae bacterium]